MPTWVFFLFRVSGSSRSLGAISKASQVLSFGLLAQVFCTRSGRGRNSALTLGFLWVAPEPWYFYVDRELAVTTWVVFLFRVVRFRWGQVFSQVLGLPCSPPIRVGEVEILPQLFGYRSCFVALQPGNLFE